MASGRVESGAAWRAYARRVADLGYDTLSLPNHLATQTFAPLPALVAAADAAPSLRVGTLVIDNESVHPAIIANECATVDVLTDGRLEVGIGAGWLPADHTAIGQPWAPAGERIERLAEAVEVLRAMWGPSPARFAGRHYRIDGLSAGARPVQQPHPPILVGGGGRKVLELAARVADIVSFVPNMAAGRVGPESAASATGAATRDKLAWVRNAAGARFDEIELHVNVTLVRLGDRAEGLAKVARAYATAEADAAEVPHALVGSVDQIAEDVLRRREELGITYLTIFEGSVDAFAPVIARLRA